MGELGLLVITESSSRVGEIAGTRTRVSGVRYQALERAVLGWFKRRAFAIGVSGFVVVLGMAYTLFWGPVVRHTSVWVTPGDFWATYRAAHYVGWGDLGGVYAAHAALVTFPGILVLFAPVAMLTGAFGLSESYPLVLPHPARGSYAARLRSWWDVRRSSASMR